MAKTPEGAVKDDIRRMLEQEFNIWWAGKKPRPPGPINAWGYMPVKASAFGVNGIPDFVLCVYEKFVGIEAKAPDGAQSVNQQDREIEIRAAGGVYILASSAMEARQKLEAEGFL